MATLAWALPSAGFAQADPATKLPRFASTRSEPINVRVGPGTRYDIAWVFKKPGMPVEIIQQFDVWRKVRYFDGDEGWIHQSLLSVRRTALVRPWDKGGSIALRAGTGEDARTLAVLPSGFLVGIKSCKSGWCQVEASGMTDGDGAREVSLSGMVPQFDLWGVYPDEDVQ